MRRNPKAWNQATPKRDDMTSEMKRRANRQNARASTGPRSQAGKARVAANARRHGLSIPPWFDQGYPAEIERLARLNVRSFSSPSPQLLAQSRRLAQAQLDFVRACEVRRTILQPIIDSEAGYWPRKRKNMPRVATAVIRKRSQRLLRICHMRPTVEKVELVLSDSAKQLNGIERHEQRALGRLNRAIQNFDAACVLEAVSKGSSG
jgi:hypothetical protein